MFFRIMFSLLAFFIVGVKLNAENSSEIDSKKQEVILSILQVLQEQPDSIEDWMDDRVYLVPERICITRQGVFICKNRSAICLPFFAFDQKGVFIVCRREDVVKETQTRYEKVFSNLMNTLNLEPITKAEAQPTAVFEGFKAVEPVAEPITSPQE